MSLYNSATRLGSPFMLFTTAYFLFAYVLVVFPLIGFVRAVERKRNGPPSLWRRRRFYTACVLLLLAPLFPYAQVVVQTALFGSVLRPVVEKSFDKTDTTGSPIALLRVLSITPKNASVYVIQTDNGGPRTEDNIGVGIIYDLVHTPLGWKYQKYRWIWSDGGSAEGNTFPPYPEGE